MPKLPSLPFLRGSGDPAPPDGVAADVAASDVSRRRLLAGIAVAGTAVLLLLGYLFFGRSSAPATTLGSGVGTPRSTPLTSGASLAATGSPTPTVAGTIAAQNAVARDPFQVLYPNSTGAGTSAGTGTGGDTGSGSQPPDKGSGTNGTTGGGGTPSPTATVTPTTTPTTRTTPPPTDATRHSFVTLISSPTRSGSTYKATFQVDGRGTYTVNVGGVFAGSLKLISVHSDIHGVLYATVQYRTSTPFDIASGHTVPLSG